MRSKDLFPIMKRLRNFKFKGNFHDMEDKINVFEDQGDFTSANERVDTKESEDLDGAGLEK